MSLTVPGRQKPTWEAFDDEFHWKDEFDPQLAAEVEAYEKTERHKSFGSQAVDEYYRLHEMNKESRKEHRFYHQDDWKKRREGRILHMNEFLRLLRECGLKAEYGDRGGAPKTLPLRVRHDGFYPECKGMHESGGPHYVCFVQVPMMQEYEEVFFDEYDLPLGPKRRGWRTVLLRLIEKKFLTEKKAHEVFGRPPSNPISERYLSYLHFLRNFKPKE